MVGGNAEMLVERPVLQGVIDQLGLPKTPEKLKKSITVEPVRDTQLLVISVEDPNPVLAAEIANTMASSAHTTPTRAAIEARTKRVRS